MLQGACITSLLIWVLVSFGVTFSGLSEQGALGGPRSASASILQLTRYLQALEIYDIDYVLLGGSIILALLYGATFLSVTLSGSVRNAPRYKTMRENFRQIGSELATVEHAACQQDGAAAVRAFVARVHSIMSGELADWVRLGDLDCGKETARAFPQ
jgi:hypothetical protein